MSSGLRLASSEGKPLASPDEGAAASPAAHDEHLPATGPGAISDLARCDWCGSLNGQSATACWSCEGALTPIEPTHELLMPEGSVVADPPPSTAPAVASQPDRAERFWDDAPTVPTRPFSGAPPTAVGEHPGDAAPVLTNAIDDFGVAVAHRLQAQHAQRRSRRAILAVASLGVVMLVAAVAYLQLSSPDVPSLQATSTPFDPAPPAQGALPAVVPEPLPIAPEPARKVAAAGPARVETPVAYRPTPPITVAVAPAPPNKARWTRAPVASVSSGPASRRGSNAAGAATGAGAAAAPGTEPAPRREACSPTVAALGLCASPSP